MNNAAAAVLQSNTACLKYVQKYTLIIINNGLLIKPSQNTGSQRCDRSDTLKVKDMIKLQ
jgi:hypothetical protein